MVKVGAAGLVDANLAAQKVGRRAAQRTDQFQKRKEFVGLGFLVVSQQQEQQQQRKGLKKGTVWARVVAVVLREEARAAASPRRQ